MSSVFSESIDLSSPARPGTVAFKDPEITILDDPNPVEVPVPFLSDLFADQTPLPTATAWLPILLNSTKSDVRTGLRNELRDSLLIKYEPKEDLIFLQPPKVNREILPTLGSTVLARDKHHLQSQSQVGASLHAFGSGFSELASLDSLRESDEGKAAFSKLADGIRLLADHHYRLSQQRRAFIIPSLNFLAKTVSDTAAVDDCLFGTNFAEEINTAQTIEKVARKMARKPQHQSSQPQPPSFVRQRPKNPKGPPRQEFSTRPSRKGPPQPSRPKQPVFRSKSRTRR